MNTPVLGQFLNYINGFVAARNGEEMGRYIQLEPPFNDLHQQMVGELQRVYHKGQEAALDKRVTDTLKAVEEGAWTAFANFMVEYLAYLRDVSADPTRYLETYGLLSELQKKANSALNHDSLGYLVLPVVIANAQCVCRLAIGLDKQPQLMNVTETSDDGTRETLPERAANILRKAFTTCTNDRSAYLTPDGRPDGKKRGIYILANLCLKILFQCRKTRNAKQIFEGVANQNSPPFTAYPKSQRVTYLYYLGRYLFQNSHFHRAHLALQYAYDECPVSDRCIRQRRRILIYLLTCNIILGRFPSHALLQRPEAHGLAERFMPLCLAISKGDLAAFALHLDIHGPHAPWFLHFRILLQLRNRGEVLAWRSLVRKIWLLNGTRPAPGTRVAPQVDLADLVAAFRMLDNRRRRRGGDGGGGGGSSGSNSLAAPAPDSDYTDPDFAGVHYSDADYTQPDTTSVESKLAALIDQGLLSGFLSHDKGKFAIKGALTQGGNILAAGFPQPWKVLVLDAAGEDEAVPGWKKQPAAAAAAAAGGAGGSAAWAPGSVVNLNGARPVGAFG
nr:pci domain-containing protein [Quercus suber]